MLFSTDGRVTAVLGPTNTGKTYLAIERMLGHSSGMIGFPLRLLARENYDRCVKQVGPGRVALVTGEEKIIPPNPSYFVCTVESMPVERQVAFMAVDEVQMAADPERGHFFTDRLLSARGTEETMLLGSDTIRPILQRLHPDIDIVSRPRFSTLSYTGPKKITRLPRRSAVVGFSVSEVYAMAELIRRQRGGAAIVMGALSPRTRNAQVEMFQSGEVEYLVATDAIGMGLNMDVNHVCFAGLRKFDGRGSRSLAPAELAQIAGRAGRHMNDGTFGTTAELGGLDQEAVEAIENHRFDPLKVLQWRNPDLDFGTIAALLRSLEVEAPHAVLTRVREQDDHVALHTLTANNEIADRARSGQRVRLLWDVCQIPDFRKTMAEEHLRLLTQIFLHLASSAEQLSEDWVDGHVAQLERYEGDIDTLMGRIAHTRTWTYISHRVGWLQRASYWQERTRSIEDRLSDVLHEQLTQRFVDRRAAVLARRLEDDGEMTTAVNRTGEVTVSGEYLGRIEGFRFLPDIAKGQTDHRTVISAALRALRSDMPTRLQAFATCPDPEITIDEQFRLLWGGGAVARLVASGDILAPKIDILSSDLLDGPAREIVRKRCADWVDTWIARGLPELNTARKAEEISGNVRGIVFRLCEKLGVMPREPAEEQLATFDEQDRKIMARLGVRVGIYSLYLTTMLKPAALRLRAQLWTIANSKPQVPALPAEGRTSVELPPNSDRDFFAAIGFLPLGDHALRADMVERLAAMARQAVRDSREAHHRAQVDRRASEAATREAKDEINEWMIVAAALGATEEAPAALLPVDAAAAAPQEPSIASQAVAEPETAAEAVEMSSPVCFAESLEVRVEQPAAAPAADNQPSIDATATESLATEQAQGSDRGGAAPTETPVRPLTIRAKPKPKLDLPVLPPGHFRASAEMLSLVGCNEVSIAPVLRALGYRAHQPSEQTGPLFSFSLPPRFPREERPRQRPDRRPRDSRAPRSEEGSQDQRPRRHESPSPTAAGEADRPQRRPDRRDAPGDTQQAPREQAPQATGGNRPADKATQKPGREREQRFDQRKRRDSGGPAVRLVASTEKKGGPPASDSPFAKLLELKFGNKK